MLVKDIANTLKISVEEMEYAGSALVCKFLVK